MRIPRPSAGCLGLFAIVCMGVLATSCARQESAQGISNPLVEISTVPSRIAITIDDLPYVPRSRTSTEDGLRYVETINAALAKHDIIATGFAVGQQVDAETIPAIQAFADGGHTIGNHSWSHADYGTLSSDQFRDETVRTDDVLKKWMAGARYYRFPFLREGETAQSRTAARQILAELDYQNVPVTIDNDEWQYNADYLQALGKGDDAKAERIARRYLAHMQERTLHFQNLARNELGGDVDHILLIHLNRINADHLETLLDWYAAQGWAFIKVEEALKDPLYSQQNRYTGPRGLSQIERVLGQAGD